MIIIIILIGNFSIPKILVLRILNPGISGLAKLDGIQGSLYSGSKNYNPYRSTIKFGMTYRYSKIKFSRITDTRGTFLQGPLYIPDFIGGLEGTKKTVTLLRVIIPFDVDAY